MRYCESYCEEKGISTSQLNEAQRTLHYIAENMKMEKSISEDGYKHFQMAIKALETVSCIKEKCAYCPHCENCDVDDETLEIKALEQQPCEDAISRQEVLDQAVDYGSNTYLIPVNSVKTLPPVTPKEKTGHWYIRKMYSLECNSWECSECKEVVYEKTKYCPNCGARMVSE